MKKPTQLLALAEDNKWSLYEKIVLLTMAQRSMDDYFRSDKFGSEVEVKRLCHKRDRIYDTVMKQFTKYQIQIVPFQALNAKEMDFYEVYFQSKLLPDLRPLLVERTDFHPILADKGIYATALLEGKNGKEKIGVVSCAMIDEARLVESPYRAGVYMLAEEIILHFLPQLFEKYNVVSKNLFRVIYVYDQKICKQIHLRLEFARDIDGKIAQIICKSLNVKDEHIIQKGIPLDMDFVAEFGYAVLCQIGAMERE